MTNKKNNIIIFSSATGKQDRLLSSQITLLGYPPPEVIKERVRLLRRLGHHTAGAMILLLGDDPQYEEEVVSLLPDISDLRVLGLFTRQSPLFIQPVVKTCLEFETFPCNNEELDFRLGKVMTRKGAFGAFEDELSLKINMVGNSPEFKRVIDKVHKITQCDAPVFIDGETGTGKELVARAIHYLGTRKDRPFIAANCGAIPDQLVENELFGHEKGAFTDARDNRDGLVAMAEGGTLFLDEIETLSHKGQIVLLRFLENMHYRPLGGSTARCADVRIIAATNESIAVRVEEGTFRKDLYYRINIMNIDMPPLRDRRDDIYLLAEHFIRQFQIKYGQPQKKIHADSLNALKFYDWPGNVREMENMLHREFLMADGNLITLGEIESRTDEEYSTPDDRQQQKLMAMPMVNAKDRIIAEFEKKYLKEVLAQSRGNISEAARRAGKERRSFTRLLEKYDIDRRDFKAR